MWTPGAAVLHLHHQFDHQAPEDVRQALRDLANSPRAMLPVTIERRHVVHCEKELGGQRRFAPRVDDISGIRTSGQQCETLSREHLNRRRRYP